MLPPLNFNAPPNTPAVISNLNRRRRRPVHRPTLAAADALAASGVFPTRPRFSSSSSSSASAGARRGQGRRPRLRPRRSWAGLGCRARHCHRESATPLLLLPRLRCLGSSASPAVCGTCSGLAASRSAGPSYQARRRGAVAGLHLLVQHRPEGKQEQVGIVWRAVYVTHISVCHLQHFINLLAHSVTCLHAVSILFDPSPFESDFIATKCLCSL
ncbi:hypothetical protein SORBI_3007G010550 [Sorghum bicolor]|uniref:Uncharacterized protein n=1 Tax=Sorghum bicolor TaxID=4558 RepID=A0A1Z5R7M5_SORBI|nr:hypothetical protein SORBI_3007G010550 [Sorghum bicolor]OQU79773.1 hypothetical protein SORBI_3007G010550 [Sorghum bicolor]OQU79774.1 hypothetical protein SORBI_3007G010550 [Sorghum bicolor]OQU79776.1 hypothetical protein SORBI_3007G010550 [Sorghum bicolor]